MKRKVINKFALQRTIEGRLAKSTGKREFNDHFMTSRTNLK